MIVAVGVGDAAASRSNAVQAPFIEGLQEHQNRSRLSDLLRIDQLFTAAELAGGDVVLDTGYHHGNDGEGLGDAHRLGNHPDLHHLCLNLVEAGRERAAPGTRWNQHPGRSHQRVHDVTHPQEELLDPARDPGAHDRLV